MNIDTHWSNYYAQNKDFGLITSRALSQILECTDGSLPKTCLDVGCGTGQLTRELFHRGYQCLGIDSSSKAIEVSQTNTMVPGLEYIKFDIESDDISSLPGQPYSLITCKLVIAFIKDKDLFLKKMRQLTRDEGIFVVITPTYINDSDATPISVNHSETIALLEKHFKSVSTFELANLSYYICK